MRIDLDAIERLLNTSLIGSAGPMPPAKLAQLKSPSWCLMVLHKFQTSQTILDLIIRQLDEDYFKDTTMKWDTKRAERLYDQARAKRTNVYSSIDVLNTRRQNLIDAGIPEDE